jgi:hypothetical protein
MNDDSLVSGDVDTWKALTPERADDLISALAEAARRHRVMVSITISPYEPEEEDESA